MYKKDDSIRNISNVTVSKECHKKLKIVSLDREITIQDVCAEILEKQMSKKNLDIQSTL